MAVYRRGNRWRAVAYYGGKQHYLGTRDTKAEAKALERQFLDQPLPISTRATFGTWIDEWFPVKFAGVSRQYRLSMDAHRRRAKEALGHIRLSQLTPHQLNRFYMDLLDDLSPSTVRKVHILIKSCLEDAPLAVNPAKSATAPKGMSRGQRTHWDERTLTEFLDRAVSHEDYPFWLIAAMTGMRRGEVHRLRWEDFDFDRGTVTVLTSKSGYGRTVSLDANTLYQLQRLSKGSGRIFTMHIDTYGDRFQRFCEREGFEPIGLHGLRHTHATIMLMNGVPLKIVSERLGHKSVSITADIYGHVLAGRDREAAEVFAAALGNEKVTKR